MAIRFKQNENFLFRMFIDPRCHVRHKTSVPCLRPLTTYLQDIGLMVDAIKFLNQLQRFVEAASRMTL